MRASKKVKGAVLLTAGAALFLGAPTVYADGIDALGGAGGSGGDAGDKGNVSSTNNGGLLSGLQLLNNTDVNVPVTLCGVGAILALGSGDCEASAGGSNGGAGGDGGSAIAGSTGKKKSGGGGGDVEATGGRGGSGGDGGSKGHVTSSGNGGLLNGLQVGNNLDLNVPVTACGVGALLARGKGDCDVSAGGQNGGSGGDGGRAVAVGKSGKGKGEVEATGGRGGNGGNAGNKGNVSSRDNDGILTGAQVLNNSDLNIPITLCGVALLAASAGCDADVSAGGLNGGGGGDGGGALALGGGRHGGGDVEAEGGRGGNGGNAGSTGNVTSSGNDGILTGLQLLNNASVNVPVTVCGLALLGAAGCEVEVSAGGANGGDGGDGGKAIAIGGKHKYWDDDDEGVGSKHRHYQATVVRSAHKLPHTGAAGLALIPFGMALVAGGFALRRRSNSGAEA